MEALREGWKKKIAELWEPKAVPTLPPEGPERQGGGTKEERRKERVNAQLVHAELAKKNRQKVSDSPRAGQDLESSLFLFK